MEASNQDALGPCYICFRGRHHLIGQGTPGGVNGPFALAPQYSGPSSLLTKRHHQPRLGRIAGDPAFYVPETERPKMIRSARAYLAAILIVIGCCIFIGSAVPLLFIWGPRIYSNWLNFFGFLSQHAGLRENAYDHRLNTRTFTMNPALEFLYNNMNYHVEHHLYPLIPYYALPKLHRRIKDQLPHTYSSLLEITAEVIPAVWRQAFDPEYFITRTTPDPASKTPAAA